MSNTRTIERPMTRRRRANHDRILAAALEIVSEVGLSGLTIAGVAAATDYTPAALYRYFDSKEALISALTTRVINEIANRTATALANTDSTDPLERIEIALAEYVAFAFECPAQYGLVSMLMADPQVVLTDDSSFVPAITALERGLAPLAALLAAAEEAKLISPGPHRERATVLFAATHGILQLKKQSARSQVLGTTSALAELATRSLLAGWRIK